jgi:hypothetical protein
MSNKVRITNVAAKQKTARKKRTHPHKWSDCITREILQKKQSGCEKQLGLLRYGQGWILQCLQKPSRISSLYLYTFFIDKTLLLYVNLSMAPYKKWYYSQCFTPLLDIRFSRHVSNPFKDLNMERHIPHLFM